MGADIMFYRLQRKFLEREQDVPSDAKQVLYQALALGHHIGVIDCLNVVLQCPQEGYGQWIARLPPGEARRKLEGVARFGEIMIDASHTQMLAAALSRIAPDCAAQEQQWTAQLIQSLAAIEAEPAMYLMVRRREH